MAISPMPVATGKREWTDEELLAIEHEGKVELVDGELILMTPAGLEQEDVVAALIEALRRYVRKQSLGRVYASQAGYRPDENLLSPDVSFVRTERLPDGKSPKGFAHFAPDLAVEVFAPDETVSHYSAKVDEYLRWGVQLVWLIDPGKKTVTVYRPQGEPAILTINDELSGEDVVPGFLCRVQTLFE